MVQTPLSAQALYPDWYPDSDGQPMADNTLQYQWIVRLVENLKHLLKDQTAFVAGDLLWYPVRVEREKKVPCQAPDAMVVLGRPDGYRGSYKQWQEEGIAPQVVFEIISPSNTAAEMVAKQSFYARHGVLEMYFYDPDSHAFWGFARSQPQAEMTTMISDLKLPWISPCLQIRFELHEAGLEIFYPDGEPFKTFEELTEQLSQTQAERDQAQAERDQAQAERDQAQVTQEQTQAKLERAIAQLKAAGIDPNDV
ncbi:MAG: Uma2 family endonuclease [Cyanobacteria bacterium P01_G01_bin.54]